MGLTGRQESGLEHGERLLAFANEYRKEHPEASLSEIDDVLREQDDNPPEYLQGFTYGSNGDGKTVLPGLGPEDILDTVDQFGDVHRYRI